ncbi:unnamed protein product, partial [marine sediment metagenome]
HILGTWHLGKRWWKDNARGCGLGYMADATPVENSERAAVYMVKYLGKQWAGDRMPKGRRHVWVSQNWPKSPALPENGFLYGRVKKSECLTEVLARLEGLGYELVFGSEQPERDWIAP